MSVCEGQTRSKERGPPGGGRARRVTGSINMALLTEGDPPTSVGRYEPDRPGPAVQIPN